MRANPLVCVEVEEVEAYDEWVSVIDSGQYEEWSDAPGRNSERLLAHQLLQAQPMWWEPASTARVHRDPTEPFIPVFYRIRIERITGHQATRDTRDAISYSVAASSAGRLGRLGRALSRVFGG